MLNGGLSIIKESMDRINPSECNAAQFILEYPGQMVKMTVSELAKASGSSPAAIMRLCKRLGLEGYQELKLRVAGDLQEQFLTKGEEYQEISSKSNIETIISSVSNNNIFSIKQTLNVLDKAKIDQAVVWLNQAKRIDFFGAGASQLVAQDAQHKFMRINKTSTAYPDPHLQLTSAVSLTEADAAVAFSYSGETLQVIECMKQAKIQGAKTIAITKYGSNTLGELCDLQIETLSTESDIRSAATSSRIVQLNVIDILFVAVASHHYEESLKYLNHTRSAISHSFKVK